MKTRRPSERGSALMITMIIIAILLAGGALIVGLQVKSTRSTDLSTNSKAALHCAEAGLAAARPVVAANYAQWNTSLCTSALCAEPAWLAAIDHDLDNPVDGSGDFIVNLKDDDDELPPLVNDPTRDNNLKVFIVVTCTKYPGMRKQISELLEYNAGGNCYQSQLGGCGGNNNSN